VAAEISCRCGNFTRRGNLVQTKKAKKFLPRGFVDTFPVALKHAILRRKERGRLRLYSEFLKQPKASETMQAKIGRNDPCPCGSGKKYKQCCYNTEKDPADRYSRAFRQEAPEGGTPEEKVLLLDLVTRLRRRMLQDKPHIQQYNKIRQMHNEITITMAEYYDAGKYERRVDPSFLPAQGADGSPQAPLAAELPACKFDLSTDIGYQGLYDCIFYQSALNVNCITRDFLQTHQYRNQEEHELLQNMFASKLGLYEITGKDPEEGYVYLKEVFTGEEYTIVDVGLSGTAFLDVYFYTRIITHQGISFCTGMNLTFVKDDPFIQWHIAENRANYKPQREYFRFVRLYTRFCENPGNVVLCATSYST
jgi:hypothetical protein